MRCEIAFTQHHGKSRQYPKQQDCLCFNQSVWQKKDLPTECLLLDQSRLVLAVADGVGSSPRAELATSCTIGCVAIMHWMTHEPIAWDGCFGKTHAELTCRSHHEQPGWIMNPHNTQLLYQRYPRLYPQPLAYGFECADGWFDLINQLSADIETECQRLVREEGWQWADLPIAEQVKQKFGGLRFYLSEKANAALRDFCERAEKLAANTCEHCGAPGERRTRANSRQVYTSCDGCLDQPLHR